MGGGKNKDSQGPVLDMASPLGSDPYGPLVQPMDPSMMGMLNAPNTGSNAQIAQYAVDNDDIVETIKSELRGYRIVQEYDIEKKEYVAKEIRFGDPVMNEMGVNETCRILRMFLSKPFVLSNFPKEDRPRIDMMMKILWKKLAAAYATKAHDYEIDRTRRSTLAFSIVSTVYMNIMRSYEDGERPRMYGSHKTLQSIQQYAQPQAAPQKKFLGGLLG
jgi:hypothetical protein